ncbi:putative metalloprotease CJM1_0395 family protein [Shewanella sp. Isolate7]|uniref:putative metalloprotease CJM1_0395 family protein n=1 Tax=Shewanella sp. Isolate7 TaxID=2908528 RepID=UPI001EFE50B7|nr:putative metalloprotease CJM1_0395 family protein [Shewanella sp. Isolate7]MCG9721136.1 hypothetical protein [Shewanella sp. Isolate7]
MPTPSPITSSVTSSISNSGSSSGQGGYSLARGPLGIDGLLNQVSSPGLGDGGIGSHQSVFSGASGIGAQATDSRMGNGLPSADPARGPGREGRDTNGASAVDGEKPRVDIFGRADETSDEAYNPFADEQQDTAGRENGLGQEPSSGQDSELARQEAELKELSRRDAEVRAHEQAHASVGGTFARSPSFKYEQGSDGRRYAVDGEVSIDISSIPGDPLATLNKMKQVYAAAMAPVTPSMADIRVASEALRKMNSAKAELAKARQESAISPQQTQPLIDAGKSEQQRQLPEAVTPRVSGSADNEGKISGARVDSPSPLDDDISPSQSIERISRHILASDGLVFTSEALSMRYQSGESQSSSFTFTL